MTESEQTPLYGFPVLRKFNRYSLINVFERSTPEIRAMAVAFWKKNGILPVQADPERRARQLALMVFRDDGALAGVSTVYRAALKDVGVFDPSEDPHYFYRMFIQPQDRIPELMREMTNGTYEMLQSLDIPDKTGGFVIVSENSKLMRSGMKRKFERNGYRIIGRTPTGQDVYRRNFL